MRKTRRVVPATAVANRLLRLRLCAVDDDDGGGVVVVGRARIVLDEEQGPNRS